MRKVIALILVMLLAFSLVGCKSKGYSDDEEIAVIAGDETQVDINEDNGVNEQKQKIEEPEEKVETLKENVDVSDKTTAITEITDKVVDTSTEITDTDVNTTQTEQITDSAIENKSETSDKKEDVNQLKLDLPTECVGMLYETFSFNSISDMIHTIKTHEYTISNEERKLMEACHNQLGDKQLAAERIAKLGTKEDVRFESFNVDSVKYFYKIKDIPGYTLTCVGLHEKEIYFNYAPISKEKITHEDTISVTYFRNEHFVTDNYLDDYMEYYKIKDKIVQPSDNKESIGVYLYEDGFLYKKSERSEYVYAIAEFPVENTMIKVIARGDMANYEALKKLCVAEKVVVK